MNITEIVSNIDAGDQPSQEVRALLAGHHGHVSAGMETGQENAR